jgi:mannosylglycerate hydrolase
MKKSPDKKTVVLVSHTHWDREWYLAFQQYRQKLLRVIDRVIEYLEHDEAFRHFLLDGQAIILEDYGEIHPDRLEILSSLVRSGKLSIGPWYILPDEFLVCAEALVRNMLIGHEVCARFGGVQKVGYMPDSFGHIAQLPQILQKGGMNSFIYTRGNGDEIDELGSEFIWRAPDGSEVLAIQQSGGYCNAGGLGSMNISDVFDEKPVDISLAVDQFTRLLARLESHSNGAVFLFNNGCDHFPPQPGLGTIMEALSQKFPDMEIIHGSLNDFLDKLRVRLPALKSFKGELLSGKYHHILSGVWSSRIYLKQLNHKCQVQLTRFAEPLMAVLYFNGFQSYPDKLLDFSWKSLLKNHPHDSICGCSVDEVHREMIPRFESVLQNCTSLVAEGLKSVCQSAMDDDSCVTLLLFNPLPVRRTVVADRYIMLPKGWNAGNLELVDDNGQLVAFHLGEKLYADDFWMADLISGGSADDQRTQLEIYRAAFPKYFYHSQNREKSRNPVVRLQFVAIDLPAYGLIHYTLKSGNGKAGGSLMDAVRISSDTLENRFYRLKVHLNGTFDLTEKTSGRRFTGLNLFEDSADTGDEYDFAPAAVGGTVTTKSVKSRVECSDMTQYRGTLRIVFDWLLPTALRGDRKGRLSGKVRCRIETGITLESGSRLVKIRTRIDNRAKDHRLRVLFPTGLRSHEVISDGHFYLNHRTVNRQKKDDWVQAPTGTYPQQDFSLIQYDQDGFILLNKGLPEIAPVAGKDGKVTLAMTLIRAVNWLSRDDLSTRKGDAGPKKYTPEAQCTGEHIFEYAVATFKGDLSTAGVTQYSDEYQAPVLLRTFGEKSMVGQPGGSLLQIDEANLRVSALKKHNTRDTLICRLCNLTGRTVDAGIRSGLKIKNVWRTDLLEERGADIPLSDLNSFMITMLPYEITTLEIEFIGIPGEEKP